MRAAIIDPAGVVTNLVEVAPREVPTGAVLIPAGLNVAVGWTYRSGRFFAPAAAAEPEPPATRDIEAEFAEKAAATSTLAGLRAVVRDYLAERSAAS